MNNHIPQDTVDAIIITNGNNDNDDDENDNNNTEFLLISTVSFAWSTLALDGAFCPKHQQHI